MSAGQASSLETHILTYGLTIIASFLVLLMLLWHISTAHLIDGYGMPGEWEKGFLKKQFAGGRGALWGILFAAILIDCVLALLALDYYHGCLYDRGEGGTILIPGAVKAHLSKSNANARQSTSAASHDNDGRRRHFSTDALTPRQSILSTRCPRPQLERLTSRPPHTYHPLHSSTLSPSQKFFLQTAYDTLIIGLLALHIASFFTSLPSNMRTCQYNLEDTLDDIDPLHTKLTAKQRCVRINIDIQVSGGFDIAVCTVLFGLHLWHFASRLEEYCRVRVGWGGSSLSEYDDIVEGEEKATRHTLGRSLPNSRFVSYNQPRSSRAFSTGIGEERRMGMDMGIRYADWSKEKRRGSGTTSRTASGSWGAERARWSEVLLECLVP